MRTNERAAAALGINIVTAKLFAFALASAIAALGGILLAFRLTSISYQSFTNFTSITYAGLSLVGGVGHLLGAFVGGMMATAGFNQEVMESTWDGVGEYIQLISGIAILLVVLYNPDGVAAEWVEDLPLPQADEEVRRVVLHQARRRVGTGRRRATTSGCPPSR